MTVYPRTDRVTLARRGRYSLVTLPPDAGHPCAIVDVNADLLVAYAVDVDDGIDLLDTYGEGDDQ